MEKKEKIRKEIKNIDREISSLREQRVFLTEQLKNAEKSEDSIGYKMSDIRTDNISDSSLNNRKLSTDDKVNLFMNLFKGRNDVYASLWISSKTGRFGYSPVCKNEGNRKICRKYIIKCRNCPNREFAPLDRKVIYNHLAGEYVAGIYPLLKNEKCNFLAVDFDGKGWVENVFAFKNRCLVEGVPVSIERSRSGNGAHAWIFFKEEIPAFLARKMGSYLITMTMSERYQLSMKSYDRLFPNQDTMPKGGFGNLIALPLQKNAVKSGNSVFIDENCKPYCNQWQFLSEIEKMSYESVNEISRAATKSGQVIGVRTSPKDESDPPWTILPSGRSKSIAKIDNLPETVDIVFSDRLYIKIGDLPSQLLNQIKRIASFQNPEFYKRQNMRLSTSIVPRVICCAEILENYLTLPRGCMEDVLCLLKEYNVKANIKDERISGDRCKFRFTGDLIGNQKAILKKVIKSDIGILEAPPGTGKTVIAINAIARRKKNTLILVHRKPLMEQWRSQLELYLGVNSKDIGQIGGGKDNSNGILDIAMFQSMEKRGIVDDRIIDYGFIIVDECHHVSAVTFERVLSKAKAKYILGLTATPYRRDGHQPIIHMQCGQICYSMKQKDTLHDFKCNVITKKTNFQYEWTEKSNIYDLWPKLINDKNRNELIVNDIKKTLSEGRFPIILTERREHLALLEKMIAGYVDNLVVLYGGLSNKKRRELIDKLLNNAVCKRSVLLSTGSYIGEGFDNPRLDTLFLAMPISFKGKVIQYVGRLHRDYQGKNEIRIYDYLDEDVSVLLNMYKKRLRVYKSIGYEILNFV